MSSPALDRSATALAPAPQGWRERFLVSREYSWLWLAQVISAFGDWVGLFAITAVVLAPSPAQATRIPADPVAFVPTPVALAQMTNDAHAANVRAALQELRSDVGGSAG